MANKLFNKFPNKAQSTKSLSTWQIFFWPLLINVIGLFGLIAALLGDGWLDLLSWLCLGAAVILILYAYCKRDDKTDC